MNQSMGKKQLNKEKDLEDSERKHNDICVFSLFDQQQNQIIHVAQQIRR